MTYQIPNPSPITFKGQAAVNGTVDTGTGHGISPKLTGIPLATAPWQNNVQPVSMAIATPTHSSQPELATKSGKKKPDNRSTELIYAEELIKKGKVAVRDQVMHCWNGSYYEAIDGDIGICHALKWLADTFPERANKSMAKACMEAAVLLLPQMPERDIHRTLIPLKNAYIEMKNDGSIERHKPDPSFGITFALRISLPGGGKTYTPGLLPPTSRLAKFLHSSVPDQDLCDFLQELMGDTLTPTNRHQVATLLKGGGRNGKSVLVRLMSALHERVAPMRLDKLSGFQLMPLLHASLVIVEEVPASGFDEQMLKALISGESVTVDRKYLSPISYRPTAKWLISTNNDQRSRDNTTGFWRRLCIVPFTQQVAPMDVIPGLDQDIITHELQLLLDWCLTGLQRLMVRGKLPPEPMAVRQAKQKAVVASNPVAAWVQDEGVEPGVDATDQHDKDAVFARYCHWCTTNKVRNMTSVAFWTALRAMVDLEHDGQHRVGGKRVRHVRIRFDSDAEQESGVSAAGGAAKTPFDD